jgi:hypothetical protein
MSKPRLLALLAITMAAGLLLTGCKDMMDVDPDVNVAWHWVSPPQAYNLWAGQHTLAGTVTVWSTEETLYVRYDMTDNWWLEETHVAVAESLLGIPHNKGGPIPGQFEFSATHDPRVQTYTYAIPVKPEWDDGLSLYICAHAVAVQIDKTGKVIQRQTGWGGDEDYPGKNWAKYIKYERKLDRKDVKLPTDCVTMVAHLNYNKPGAKSYWLVTLSDVPSGYDVWDGDWLGWCGELKVDMDTGVEYHVRLWSSIDPGLPARLQDTMWDNINYLLNNKLADATALDIQFAVWALRGDLDWWPGWGLVYPKGKQMYDDALAHGDGFYPGQGDVIAVIIETPEEVQLCFIEVDP